MAPRDSLLELIKEYALCGFKQWETADSDLRRRASTCLQNMVVDSENDFHREMNKLSHEKSHEKFFPMPTGSYQKDLNYCFFRTENRESFQLYVLLNDASSLAFRFEPADQLNWSHNYAHVQFCRKFKNTEIRPHGIPAWLPESYPAFPLPSSNSLELFLAMVTAVHGRAKGKGIEEILRSIFQKASQTGRCREILNHLNQMLGE